MRAVSGEIPAAFAKQSLACVSTVRNTILSSSRSLDWTSVLLDHVQGRGEADVYDKPVTPDVCLTVPTSGEHEISVLRNGRWQDAISRPGAVSLTQSGDSNRLRWRNRSTLPFTVANLYIPRRFVLEAAEHFRRPGQVLKYEPAPITQLDKRLIALTVSTLLSAADDAVPDLYAEQAARWLAVHLIWPANRRFEPAGRRRDPGAITDVRLARVIEFMSTQFKHTLSIPTLAREAGISRFHFTRLFRQKTGLTPYAYLSEIRSLSARQLLDTTDLSISAIAIECGYSRSTAFTAAFSKRFGESPRSVRAQARL